MNKNDKIAKLEKLGAYNQWKYNIERANETFNIECYDSPMTNEEWIQNFLDVDCCCHWFLTISFPFYNIPECVCSADVFFSSVKLKKMISPQEFKAISV